MMTEKRYRMLKVYRYIKRYKDYKPIIKLQGNWLEKLDFKDGDAILVDCRKRKIIITDLKTGLGDLKKSKKRNG